MNKIEAAVKKEQEASWENRVWEGINFDEGQFNYEVFKREGFSIKDIIKKKGVAVEVAGPTEKGFWFHDFSKKGSEITSFNLAERKKILTSNLYPGTPIFSEGSFDYWGKTDFIADARAMPVKEGGVDLVYCSSIASIQKSGLRKIIGARPEDVPLVEKNRLVSKFSSNEAADKHKLREQVIDESWNILRPGGILIWRSGNVHDVGFAIRRGFVLLQREQGNVKAVHGGEPWQNVIFLKPEFK